MISSKRFTRVLMCSCFFMLCAELQSQTPDVGQRPTGSFQDVVRSTQTRMVKITGGGGFRGLEAYQSGCCISDDGLVLTSWSYVLDADAVKVTLDDGQRFEGKLIGYDPELELAVLKIDASGLPHFNLDAAVAAKAGARILAFSNLYGVATGDEPVSVQRGSISAVTKLAARKGAFESVYQGQVYLLDAITNNPGAAGGVIVDRRGRLLGMIGKEVRDSNLGTWLNFAIPIEILNGSVQEIRNGKMIVQRETNQRKPTEPMSLSLLGMVLIPDVVKQTPPYVDRVVSGSVAAKAGIQADDLIIGIDGKLAPSVKEVLKLLEYVDRDARLQLTIRRGNTFEAIELGF